MVNCTDCRAAVFELKKNYLPQCEGFRLYLTGNITVGSLLPRISPYIPASPPLLAVPVFLFSNYKR